MEVGLCPQINSLALVLNKLEPFIGTQSSGYDEEVRADNKISQCEENYRRYNTK